MKGSEVGKYENNAKRCINSGERIKRFNKKRNLHYLNERRWLPRAEEEVHRKRMSQRVGRLPKGAAVGRNTRRQTATSAAVVAIADAVNISLMRRQM